MDAQPCPPQDDDQRAQAPPVATTARCTHDGDDFLDGRRVRRIAQPLVAWRATGVEPRHGRRRPTSTGTIEQVLGHDPSSARIASRDFDSAVAATNTNASTVGWQFWHPTELTQAWVDGTVANHGLLLKTPENVNQTLQFDLTYTRCKTPPYLSIEYEPRAGDLARYWLEGQTVQEGLQLSVTPANGNLLIRQTDFQLSESDLDYGIERFYNNLSPNTGTTGGGWTMNVGQDVGLLFDRDGSVAFDGPSGYTVPFNKQADGSYEPAPGVGLELVKNADGSYTITDSETDDKYSLNSNGYLTRKTDQDGGQIDYTYTSGLLTSLSDNLGRRFTFGYDQFGFLARMTDASNGIHQYTHDSKGRLLAYTNPAGARTTFAYDSLFNLVRVTPPAGAREHRFTYDSSFRVTSDTEVTSPTTGTGPKTTWSYGLGTTTRTEASGPQEHLQLRQHGHGHREHRRRQPAEPDALGHALRRRQHDSLAEQHLRDALRRERVERHRAGSRLSQPRGRQRRR